MLTFKAILGFLIFVVMLVGAIDLLSKNKKTDNLIGKFEKALLSLKIPYFLVQIIMYIIVMMPLCLVMYFAAWLTSDYLGLW